MSNPASGLVLRALSVTINSKMNVGAEKPLIVLFVSDVMFAVRIENAVRALGYQSRVVANAEAFGAVASAESDRPPGEYLYGQGGELFMQLASWQPALLIFDLGNAEIPWQRWIAALKSSAATRRIPVLCYGPHVAEEQLVQARAVGADEVVPRSRFASAMPRLIEKLAHVPDLAAIAAACREPLLPHAVAGIAAFNRGDYYEAHEELEAAWMVDQGPGRDLYRSVLQVAVAYYQIERGNYRGAAKMLLRVRQWLAPLPEHCRGIDVRALGEDVENVHAALLAAGPEGIEQIDRALFRPVRIG